MARQAKPKADASSSMSKALASKAVESATIQPARPIANMARLAKTAMRKQRVLIWPT
jgi:hypothetical protein